MHEIEIKVDKACRKIIEDLGYEFVEVKCEKIEGDLTVTLVIYKDSGITFSDCKLVSNAVDETLEELNPTNDEPYNLNVSSLGLDRPIVTKRDYERYLNKKIEIQIPSSKQKIVGTLLSVLDDQIAMNVKGINKSYNISDIIRANAYIKF